MSLLPNEHLVSNILSLRDAMTNMEIKAKEEYIKTLEELLQITGLKQAAMFIQSQIDSTKKERAAIILAQLKQVRNWINSNINYIQFDIELQSFTPHSCDYIMGVIKDEKLVQRMLTPDPPIKQYIRRHPRKQVNPTKIDQNSKCRVFPRTILSAFNMNK